MENIELNFDLVKAEFRENQDSIYLNSGCCGRKPKSALDAMTKGWDALNKNPCHVTFLDSMPFDAARLAISKLLNVPSKNVMLAMSTTNALQIMMQSFLLNAGDELVTTDSEHGSVRTIAAYLKETRGISVKHHRCDPFQGSKEFCDGLIALVTENTKLIVVSEIVSYTGWRPDISALIKFAEHKNVPLLIDGAHAPGQEVRNLTQYPMWVGSGHKWLGGPNGTAFAYVRSDLIEQLQPVAVGDKFFERRDADPLDLSRLESQGTTDVVRWLGLTEAINLHLKLGPEAVNAQQISLANYLREQVEEKLRPEFRTPLLSLAESTGLLTFYWSPDRLRVKDLQAHLWAKHRIAVQLDFLHYDPAWGMRISCHVSNTADDLDLLVSSIASVLK